MTVPLRLPAAPFDLDQALTSARLVGEAYTLTRQWQDQDRPAPDAFEWTQPEELAGFEIGDPLWASASKHPLFQREQPFGFVARRGGVAYLVLRGTENPADLVTNIKIAQVDYEVPGCEGFGKVHDGFMELHMALREPMLTRLGQLENIDTVVVAGHSMAAAVSTLVVPDLARNAGLELDRQRLVHYSFGSPRVGDPEFANSFDALAAAHGWNNVMSYRVANSEDLAVHVPPALIERLVAEDERYQHVGTAVGFSQNYGEMSANHHLSRAYIYALEHPDDPRDEDWVRKA